MRAGGAHVAEEMLREVRGVQLFERRVGTGPPVVILHGGPGAHHDYLLPGFDVLADQRTLIYYDQRGGGRSPVPREVPVGWPEQVADLEALREAWGLEQLAIAGYSWGALLAMLYALSHRDRVSHLALVSPAPAYRAARAEYEQRLAARNATPAIQAERQAMRDDGLAARDPERYRRRSFELSVSGYFHDPARVGEMTPFRITGRTQQEVWSSLGDFDLRGTLPSLRGIPAVVLHGDDDPIPVATARETAGQIGAAFHVLPACGHVPFVEALEPFGRLLGAFLPAAAST